MVKCYCNNWILTRRKKSNWVRTLPLIPKEVSGVLIAKMYKIKPIKSEKKQKNFFNNLEEENVFQNIIEKQERPNIKLLEKNQILLHYRKFNKQNQDYISNEVFVGHHNSIHKPGVLWHPSTALYSMQFQTTWKEAFNTVKIKSSNRILSFLGPWSTFSTAPSSAITSTHIRNCQPHSKARAFIMHLGIYSLILAEDRHSKAIQVKRFF